jgi:nucleoredoxin
MPSLIILDEDNKIITKEGRAAVGTDPEGSKFPWIPNPFEELSEFNVSCINEQPVLLVVLGGGNTGGPSDAADLEARAQELLAPVADATKGLETDDGLSVRMLWSGRGSELEERVLEFAGVEGGARSKDEEVMVLLDVPNQQVFRPEPDARAAAGKAKVLVSEQVEVFLKAFVEGRLVGKQLE